MSPRLVDLMPNRTSTEDRRARVQALRDAREGAQPESIKSLIELLVSLATHANLLGYDAERYAELKQRIVPIARLREFPVSAESAIERARARFLADGRPWTELAEGAAWGFYRDERECQVEWLQVERSLDQHHEGLLRSFGCLDATLDAARPALSAAVPSVSQWLTAQRMQWAPLRTAVMNCPATAPWRFDYSRAEPGTRAIEQSVFFLYHADYGAAPASDFGGGTPPKSNDDEPSGLSLTENQSKVLRTMARFDRSLLLFTKAIADEMDASERLSEETVRQCVGKLIDVELAIRPEGERRGVRLTNAGRRLAGQIAD